jgi:hypothetical protein
MARIRTIKPDFFRHAGLYDAEQETGLPLRVAFAGLWTAADREGRFQWKPRELKLDCLPFDEVDFSRVLDALRTRGHLVKYAVDGQEFGLIPSWHQHQVINNRESLSVIPAPPETPVESMTCTREARVADATPTPLMHSLVEGKGREGKGDSASATSADLPVARPPAPPAVITIPLNDGSEHGISQADVDDWGATFPAVDVMQQLRQMRAWCFAKPERRKTRRGVNAFIVNWLGREQNSGRAAVAPSSAKRAEDLYAGAL